MFQNTARRVLVRCFSQGGASTRGQGASGSSSAPQSSPASITANVTGLSSRIITPSSGPTGAPKAAPDAEYKVPEYFCYHRQSYYEAEVELAKYRLPQPNAGTK